MGFEFTGIDSSYKRPRFLGKIVFSTGAISASSSLNVLYVGMKTSAGTMTADQDVVEVFSEDDINTRAGARSELGWMARLGMRAAPNTRHFLAPYAEPTGSAGTVTVVIGGSWSTAGEYAFKIGGITVQGTIASTDAIADVGAAIVTKWNAAASGTLPATAGPTSSFVATMTLTLANNGLAYGKDWILELDKSKLPTGMTMVLAGASIAGDLPSIVGDRVRFGLSSSATGTPDVTTVLTKIIGQRYARIASGPNLAASTALFKAQLTAKSDMTITLLEQVVYANNRTAGSAETVASGTNAQRAQVVWMRNSGMHPSAIAGVMAAVRASKEGTDPVPDYDGFTLPGIPQYANDADRPLDTETNHALNLGVTPVESYDNSAHIVRAITTYCLVGGVALQQDERTLDIGDAVMTDYATLDLKLHYETVFRPANKYVGPDPATGAQEPPSGVGYPTLWNSAVKGKMQEWFLNGWIEDPTLNPPTSQYNTTARAIESSMPLIVRRVQHQMRQIIRQQAP